MQKIRRWLIAGMALVFFNATLFAEVTIVSRDGFISEHRLVMRGDRQHVYRALTDDVALWWDAAHSYSGDAANFSLEARALGCFCERWEEGEIAHMQIVHAEPGKRLVMVGGLGPLKPMGVSGAMSFELSPQNSNTVLVYRYSVSGYTADGLQNIAGPVDAVQLGQLQRLQKFLDADGQ